MNIKLSQICLFCITGARLREEKREKRMKDNDIVSEDEIGKRVVSCKAEDGN
jgi:hypothetical protein